MKCVEVYKELYHQEPFDVAFCPYRISPLGAHIDHQYGKINGLAIDKGIHMAYHPKQNGVVELQSLNFPKRAQFFVLPAARSAVLLPPSCWAAPIPPAWNARWMWKVLVCSPSRRKSWKSIWKPCAKYWVTKPESDSQYL